MFDLMRDIGFQQSDPSQAVCLQKEEKVEVDKTAPATAIETTDAEPQVNLWNPIAATNWSLLFSPIFGAWLQAKNWENLGDAAKSKKSMYWVYGGFALFFLCLFLPGAVPTAMGFLFLVAWYVTTSRKQIKHISNTLNDDYERKSWAAPLMFAGFGLVVYVLIAWIASPGVEGLLEDESVDLVSQIIADNAGGGDNPKCLRVKITEEVIDDVYRATATLDDGRDMTIMITYKDNQILVKMRPYQLQ